VLRYSWSLAVKEHFYLIRPLAIVLFERIRLCWRIALLISICVLARAWRIFEYERAGWAQTYYRFDTRMSGLTFSALFAIGLPRLGRILGKLQRCWHVWLHCTCFMRRDQLVA
jgi:peptidoglycan/LPS O-acetylase OafA/YrhL